MSKLFKILVIIAIVLQVALFFSPYSWVYLYGAKGEVMDLLAWHGYDAKFNIFGVIPYVFAGAYFVTTIGLLLFKKWGRLSFTIVTFLSVFASLMWGFTVTPAIDSAAGYILTLIDGALLAIMYLTSLSSSFK